MQSRQHYVLQVALIGSMLHPASSALAPAVAQADAVADHADAGHHPQTKDVSQDVVQVATVDSFQVECHQGFEPVIYGSAL